MDDLPDGYYAVLNPDDPATMTYWRVRTGRITAWPAKAHHGPPRLLKRDAPADRDARIAWMRVWSSRYQSWMQRLHAALIADLPAARRTFADLTVRCCECGRALTDDRSKVLGVGPECRRHMDDGVLAQLVTPQIATAHATWEAGRG